ASSRAPGGGPSGRPGRKGRSAPGGPNGGPGGPEGRGLPPPGGCAERTAASATKIKAYREATTVSTSAQPEEDLVHGFDLADCGVERRGALRALRHGGQDPVVAERDLRRGGFRARNEERKGDPHDDRRRGG